MSEEQLVERLSKGDRNALARVYTEHKVAFLAFAKRYSLGTDTLLDVYSDSVIALFENAQRGKLDHLKSSVKTYLFAIGKFKIYRLKKEAQKELDETDFEHIGDVDLYEPDEANPQVVLLRQGYKQLGKQCKELLRRAFYENKDNDVIMEELNYTSKDVVKSQKSRCLKKLREFVKR